MKGIIKRIITVTVIILLVVIIIIEGKDINKDVKHVQVPTLESRKLSRLGTYKYMTVADFTKKYNVSEVDIFKILNITGRPGDDKLTLNQLANKYGKNQDEMKKAVKQLLVLIHSRGRKR